MSSGIKQTVPPRIRLARIRALLTAFRLSNGGNVAIITGLCALPLLAAVGCVVDYSMASEVKTRLQAAADAATLATVSNNSPVVTTAQGMTGNGTVSGGATYAQEFFSSQTSAFSLATNNETVTKSGMTVTATLTYSYQVPTFFMKVLGYNHMTVSGSSTANFTLPTYIDFYLMLDVSGSMSFPSTASEQARLMAVNPDNLGEYPNGCQFACHFTAQGGCSQSNQGPYPAVGHSYSGYVPNPSPGGYCQGFTISRLGTTPSSFTGGTNSTNGMDVNWTNTPVSTCSTAGTTSCIQLRADAVGYAVTALLSQANSTESNDGISNQFQVGLFPFIQYLCTSSAGSSNSCSVGLTTSLTGSTITDFAQDLANLLDTGQNATLGSGGTHFENALSEMNSFITSVGTGTSSSNALPYVFIVTDGSQDYQTQLGGNWGSQNGTAPNGAWSATNPLLPCTACGIPYQNSATVMPGYSPNNEPNSTDECTTIKNRGITIAILYIPYGTINNPNPNFADDEDGYANANIANIPAALQSCASTNFFYTASTPADIQSALVTMFEQAVSTAHIAQ